MKRFLVYFFWIILVSALLLASTNVKATELVYTPINPAFGGYSYNAQWLLSTAQAQDKTGEKKSSYSYPTRNPLKDFQESMNRQILSRLSSKLVTQAFGEETIEPGHYEIGDYVIDVTPQDTGIRIEINEPGTTNGTTIELPYYGGGGK